MSLSVMAKLLRKLGYDYTSPGMYFITISVDHNSGLLADIKELKSIPTDIGKIVDQQWNLIPQKFPNIILDEFILMPNHLHGIIHIKDPFKINNVRRSVINHARTGGFAGKSQIMSSGSLSEIVRWFKGSSVYRIRKELNEMQFSWHKSYYDSIIRSDDDLVRIRKYIIDNPKK